MSAAFVLHFLPGGLSPSADDAVFGDNCDIIMDCTVVAVVFIEVILTQLAGNSIELLSDTTSVLDVLKGPLCVVSTVE